MKNLDYGVIGNCKSAALISKTGSIDWCCLPEFNSSSIFAHLIDNKIGGKFSIKTVEKCTIIQTYIRNTNILKTLFSNDNFVFELIDFMPRYYMGIAEYNCPPDIIRFIRVLKGEPEIIVDYNPKLNYAKGETKTSLHEEYLKNASTEGKYESIYLYSDLPLQDIFNKKPVKIKGHSFLLLSYNQKVIKPDAIKIYLEYQRTKVYWMEWCNKNIVLEEYNEEITRSSLVLKLLTYQNSGAILAAITTSLPEKIGEVRNWDYRFCWIRDAAMMIRILHQLGHKNEAKNFLDFIIDITPAKNEKIQIMYGIHGEKKLKEKILDHLQGYEGSVPVRIGNAAYKQKQHDIYGVLMDVIYQNISKYKISVQVIEELWTIVRSIVRSVEHNWQVPDKGIWEIRAEGKHFTFSKVLCWVAVDRAVKIAELLNNDTYLKEWSALRDDIQIDVYQKAWNDKKQAYTQFYGSEDMDSSNLLMETYGFIESKNNRYISTVKRTWEELSHNGLMYRYKNQDDFGLPSTSFTICNFWMARALFLIGEKKEGKELFNRVLKCANHVGILSEDIHFDSHRLLGNFPQGYSHLALIETALTISNEMSQHKNIAKSFWR